MNKGFSSDCVDLSVACEVLAKSKPIQVLLKKKVGSKHFPRALEVIASGNLDGDFGGTIRDFLEKLIRHNAVEVWSGVIRQPHNAYTVKVKGFHGVYWIWAMKYDPVGYFLDVTSAISYVRSNWDNVHEDGKDTEDEETEGDGEVRCPFCDTTDNCDHLLLVVDQTFRQAGGGVLYQAFNARWSKILEEADDPDFDECEPFEELLQEVDSLADAVETASPDSAPGLSSTFSYYFCSSKKKAMAALKEFTSD